ncbi:sensor domain-containing diguanylate cyclase [Thalassobacillus hwangdonensis]|uniref:Sensor domain-containing diguanylate cyclase n=1 Tax=Thalassobacillus hwangdonensis TaxID=546108 RepID=A0ABW3L152_9BACI
MVSDKKKKGIWLTWLLFYPVSIYFLYQQFPPNIQGLELDIFFFAILICAIAFFPVIVGGEPIFFIHGISFAVFIYFGLFVELVLTQLAVIFLLLRLRIPKQDYHRIPLNFMLFLITSCTAAIVYELLGGNHGANAVSNVYDIIPIVSYVATLIIVNQVLIVFLRLIMIGKIGIIFDKAFLWESITTTMFLPFGFVLYMLYTEVGGLGIFLVGTPFIFISVMLSMYHSSQQVNHYLKDTGDIGHQLTERMDVDQVVDLFIERLGDLLPLHYAYIYEVVDDEKIQLIRFFDKNNNMEFPKIELSRGESLSGEVWRQKEGFHFHSRKQWLDLDSKVTPEDGESVLSVPIMRSDEFVGVITVISNEKYAFQNYQYMILDILANYLSVALDNARNYEETKKRSERCPLTNLYNYRYFEDQLEKTFKEMEVQSEPLSLILLDIDHFKQVNDTYGHQSGNEILCELADRLSVAIGDLGTVARYGGEEFVIMLPYVDMEKCSVIAEEIRKAVATVPFVSHEHILEEAGPVYVSITASIGTATYPNHCEEHQELIRHADRAMYVGAKQKGRNKVASYEKVNVAVE